MKKAALERDTQKKRLELAAISHRKAEEEAKLKQQLKV